MLRVRDKGIKYLVMLWRRDDAMAASGSPAEDQVVWQQQAALLLFPTRSSLAAVSDPASPSRGRSGRNRYDWVEVCREQTDAEIRPAAKLWLREHDILHTTLQWSSDRGTKTRQRVNGLMMTLSSSGHAVQVAECWKRRLGRVSSPCFFSWLRGRSKVLREAEPNPLTIRVVG